jgi:hypothetical protein
MHDPTLLALSDELRRLGLAAAVDRVEPGRAHVRGAVCHVAGDAERLRGALAALDDAAGAEAWVALWLAAGAEEATVRPVR